MVVSHTCMRSYIGVSDSRFTADVALTARTNWGYSCVGLAGCYDVTYEARAARCSTRTRVLMMTVIILETPEFYTSGVEFGCFFVQ